VQGCASFLSEEPDIEVVAEAADGDQAVAAIQRYQPDVALMDIRMPNLDGLSATRQLMANGSDTRILVLTTFDLDEYVFEALRAGASGFLLKDASEEDLAESVRVLARGDALLSPAVTRRVIEAFARVDSPHDDAHADSLAELTEREIEVLRLLACGLSNSEIAAQLILGTATVKSHVSSILMKAGLRDRAQAAIFAYESGLVRPGEAAR
jgi:DNA-binding NarL/FixJ family response regulator